MQGCAQLNSRVEPKSLSIEQRVVDGIREFVYCSTDGSGVDACRSVSQKTPVSVLGNEKQMSNSMRHALTVHFALSSHFLTQPEKAKILEKIPFFSNASEIVVRGYTDDTGSQSVNLGIAEKRAKAVADVIASSVEGGVEVNAEAHPMCCYESKGDNLNETRRLSRRAEIFIK